MREEIPTSKVRRRFFSLRDTKGKETTGAEEGTFVAPEH
jgi:hypothetical protein